MGAKSSKNLSMPNKELVFLLMGNTGYGKSATGNSLLNKKLFETSPDGTSKTKKVQAGFSKFGDVKFMIVDGPGLEETGVNNVQDKIGAVNNMTEALALCNGGVDAFLLVIKFGQRCTAADKNTLDALKGIFGPMYMDHVIVIMTYGDNYQTAVREGECDSNLRTYCMRQKGLLRQLYDDCDGRFVLFNNVEKNKKKMRAQIQQVVQLAQGLRDKNGRYTSQCFQDAESERENLIRKLKTSQPTLEIQKNIASLHIDIVRFLEQPSKKERKELKKRIQDLRQEIEVQDKGYNVLDELRLLIDQVEKNFDDKIELGSLTNHLERIRLTKSVWSGISVLLTITSNILSHTSPLAGKIVATVLSSADTAAGAAIVFAEAAVEHKMNEIRKEAINDVPL